MRRSDTLLLLLFSTYWLFIRNCCYDGTGGKEVGFKSNCQSAVKGSHSITPAKVANVFLPRFRNHYPSPLWPHVLLTDIIEPSHTFRPAHCKVHSFSLHSRSSMWAQSSSVHPLSCALLHSGSSVRAWVYICTDVRMCAERLLSSHRVVCCGGWM